MPEWLVSAEEMRAIEAREAERGNTSDILMERAGQAIAADISSTFGALSPQRALCLAGPGNNGGDALVVARVLAEHGWEARCITWSRNNEADSRLQNPLRALKIPVDAYSTRADLRAALEWSGVVVDGLLGTGIKRDVTGELAGIVEVVALAGKPVVAVDIPTGVDSDTGAVRGVALPATRTVALGLPKYGHVLQPGAALSGKIIPGDIGLSDQTVRANAKGHKLDDATIRALLPERPADSNKGTFGKAIIVAGSINYLGAPVLATEGAMRSGAGLVTLACAGDLLGLIAPKLTESTFLPLPADMGAIAARAVDKLQEGLSGYKAMLIGSGMGKQRETVNFLKSMLSPAEKATEHRIGFGFRAHEAEDEKEEKKSELPTLVLDGDALNILSELEGWHKMVPEGSVLTPHPGEMARLVGGTVDEVQSDRVGVATKSAVEWAQVVVLKGANTVIATPDGTVYVSPFANPALATAGSGDVLAGAIAGFIAQGLSPADAACVGVYLHGLAGEMLAEEYGPAGGLAGELPVLLARAQRRVREGK